MAKYRTAHGKTLDIEKLRLQNEDTIAVGNMKVNARGDQLGQGGKVIAGRNQVMNQQYKISGTQIGEEAPVVLDVAPDGESFDPPEYQEPVKQPEPKLRGSLASSIAKQPEQPTDAPSTKGPARI